MGTMSPHTKGLDISLNPFQSSPLVQQSSVENTVISNFTAAEKAENSKSVLHRHVYDVAFQLISTHSIVLSGAVSPFDLLTIASPGNACALPALESSTMNLHHHWQSLRFRMQRHEHVDRQAVLGDTLRRYCAPRLVVRHAL